MHGPCDPADMSMNAGQSPLSLSLSLWLVHANLPP